MVLYALKNVLWANSMLFTVGVLVHFAITSVLIVLPVLLSTGFANNLWSIQHCKTSVTSHY